MYYQNGDVYEGGFKIGLKHGYGKEFFKNGFIYEGEYREDKADGEGSLRQQTIEEINTHFGDAKIEKESSVILQGQFRDDRLILLQGKEI